MTGRRIPSIPIVRRIVIYDKIRSRFPITGRSLKKWLCNNSVIYRYLQSQIQCWQKALCLQLKYIIRKHIYQWKIA